MKRIQLPITLFILVALSSCADQDEEILSSSACYGIDLPCTSHHLRCPVGSLITVISAQYGYKYRCGIAVECTACCWYREGDCMVEYKSGHYQELFKNCSLQTQCSFRAPWISHTVCSDLHRTFLTSVFSFISYKCVHVYGVGSNREDDFTTQSLDFGSTNGETDVISQLSDHPRRHFPYNTNQDSVHKDPSTVTIVVLVLTVTIAAVVVLVFLIKFRCCKKLLSVHRDHIRKQENTHEDVRGYNENETYGYSVVNTRKEIQNHTNWDESVRDYNEDQCNGYSVINVSKHNYGDSPISVAETCDVSSDGNHGNYDRIMAHPIYNHLGKVDETYHCDNLDTVITPVDNSHIYSVVNKTKSTNS